MECVTMMGSTWVWVTVLGLAAWTVATTGGVLLVWLVEVLR